ncbi:MAG: CPBP family intramembrane metalloprotease [Proteobacteria bacterium]|nr:CPBP family intramembrane metalloprotease [Pseudomonadota bacterium]
MESETSVPPVALQSEEGRWSVIGAVLFVATVMGAAVVATFGMQLAYKAWRATLAPEVAIGWPAADDPALLISLQVIAQLLELVLIWWLVGIWHKDRRAALNLAPAHLKPHHWIGIILLLFAAKLVATVISSGLVPTDTGSELGPFMELARSPKAWLIFMAAVVLAGPVEELLFRGVLSRTLEGTWLGFWGGAALASAAFAMLHVQYGVGGQIVIFAVGLTLAWIRSWSGSLWPAIVAHAFNNAAALLVMRAIT